MLSPSGKFSFGTVCGQDQENKKFYRSSESDVECSVQILFPWQGKGELALAASSCLCQAAPMNYLELRQHEGKMTHAIPNNVSRIVEAVNGKPTNGLYGSCA